MNCTIDVAQECREITSRVCPTYSVSASVFASVSVSITNGRSRSPSRSENGIPIATESTFSTAFGRSTNFDHSKVFDRSHVAWRSTFFDRSAFPRNSVQVWKSSGTSPWLTDSESGISGQSLGFIVLIVVGMVGLSAVIVILIFLLRRRMRLDGEIDSDGPFCDCDQIENNTTNDTFVTYQDSLTTERESLAPDSIQTLHSRGTLEMSLL
jgi:hypothetical protein